jgi:hypothetical protein
MMDARSPMRSTWGAETDEESSEREREEGRGT